ncbi:MAG: RNA polymerase sigma factor [Bacteroidetes bacterium]|nr:RNA polymerase sigma factor [Bacteroidota bacterium]MCW5895747.1 RNA polymerase sigma factor [Bacteroidota bacterium]
MAAAEEPVLPARERGEQQLIQQAKEGDGGAFRLLMDRHLRQAYNIAYRFTGNHDSAEDVTQEAFVKVYAALPSFRGDAEFSTWLHRIVVNVALTRKRLDKNRIERHVPLEEMQSGADCEHHEEIVVKERQAYIERALHELPTLQRAVVILRHMNGLSTRQVSDILRCSEGTVKTHLFRGLKKMRSRLEHLQEGLV